MAGVFESKGSSLELKARNSKLPSISSHRSANLMTISSLAICDGGTPPFTEVSLKLKSRPLAFVPSAGFLPHTLYVAEAKRPFGGARDLKPTIL
jgi:hypothetical protein